jgi:hypothetical protein
MGREAYLAGCVAADAADEEDDVRGDGRSEASGPERRRLVRTDDKAEQRGEGGGLFPYACAAPGLRAANSQRRVRVPPFSPKTSTFRPKDRYFAQNKVFS